MIKIKKTKFWFLDNMTASCFQTRLRRSLCFFL